MSAEWQVQNSDRSLLVNRITWKENLFQLTKETSKYDHSNTNPRLSSHWEKTRIEKSIRSLLERRIKCRNYDPKTEIVLLLESGAQVTFFYLKNLPVDPAECYQTICREGTEFPKNGVSSLF